MDEGPGFFVNIRSSKIDSLSFFENTEIKFPSFHTILSRRVLCSVESFAIVSGSGLVGGRSLHNLKFCKQIRIPRTRSLIDSAVDEAML